MGKSKFKDGIESLRRFILYNGKSSTQHIPDGYIKIDHCPVCHASGRKLVIANEEKNIIKCKICTHSYRKIVPNLEKTNNDKYSNLEYWHQNMNPQKIFDLEKLQQYSRFIDSRMKQFGYFGLIEGLAPNSNILEFGCGEGGLLHELKHRGYNVIGIEVNNEIVAQSNSLIGIPIICGAIENIDLPESNFDLVYSFHVMWTFGNYAAQTRAFTRSS
ncbi:MAG: class I SAM-dependent methyltransferase [Planctomycetota bacterium]|nr:class I SAM-dependent methyltransferase [Planctomycetota bacterium]